MRRGPMRGCAWGRQLGRACDCEACGAPHAVVSCCGTALMDVMLDARSQLEGLHRLMFAPAVSSRAATVEPDIAVLLCFVTALFTSLKGVDFSLMKCARVSQKCINYFSNKQACSPHQTDRGKSFRLRT